MYTFLPPYLL